MTEQAFKYIIVGGSLTGASAVGGIRERDPGGSILLLGQERHLPYERPPLTKKLWSGRKTVDQIFVHDRGFYERSGVTLVEGARAVDLDPGRRVVTDDQGRAYRYERLLLATGGTPRRLPIPGADLPGLFYYRTLDDYLRLRAEALEGRSAVVVGGGFIGSEIAAALTLHKVAVTMVFLDRSLCSRVLPESLGREIERRYRERGIALLAEDKPTAIEEAGGRFRVSTGGGRALEADMVVVGVGIAPATQLAGAAGLSTGDGIVVDQYLRTSNPEVFAAGDNAAFPYPALDRKMRVEHWDNALNQGLWAGRNMAGANEPYTHMPYFFSDLFEFGYEAVGEVDAELETFADWTKENDTGVIYYLRDGRVRGAMMCNVWDKVEAARQLIRRAGRVRVEDLRGAIR
jgi:3-phenylpropionate/trans-cinnamate dioxygenase ferredoxin reductase subunit